MSTAHNLNQEEIEQQLKLLESYRHTLAHYLDQKAQFGPGFVPAYLSNGIHEARAEIQHIKAILRESGVNVENKPGDEPSVEQGAAPQESSSSGGTQTTLIGDIIHGDKIGGDKVMGDKRTINTQDGDYAEGDIDKRRGTFIQNSTILGNVMGQHTGTCAKCGVDNPAQTKFCFKCGNQLVRKCPACGLEASLVSTGRCGECGIDYDKAIRQKEVQQQVDQHHNEVQRQISVIQQEIREKEMEHAKEQELASDNGIGCWGQLVVIVGIVVTLATLTVSFIRMFNGAPPIFESTLMGLIVIGLGWIIIVRGNTPNQHKQRADAILQNLEQLKSRSQQLYKEIGIVADYRGLLVCRKCGNDNSQYATYCTICGYQLKE